MNLPNKLSLSRIILVPFFAFFYLAAFIPYGKFIALAIFIIASITDAFDGHYARKYNLTTNLGKFLDSIADKILVNTALLLVVADLTIPAPYGIIAAIIIIARDLIVDGLRQAAAAKNVIIAADWWGKVKANFQIFAVGGFMLLAQIYAEGWGTGSGLLLALEILCYVLLGVSVLLTIISCINYLVKNGTVFKES